MSRKALLTMSLILVLAGCATTPQHAQSDNRFSLVLNYEGAEALLSVLEQTSVTDADIDRLLSIRGVQVMVDNTTKYIPSDTRDVFRAAVKEFVSTRKSTIGHFRLDESHQQRAQIRDLIRELQADKTLAADVTGPVSRYMPPLGHVAATVYAITGGASDGFVPDDETQPAFYMALNRAEGDAQGVKLNMTHELYHVVQRLARARMPGLNEKVFDPATAPAPMRLLTIVQEEGSATYVAEPLLSKGAGRYIETWRASYRKHTPAEKVAANFAEIDRMLAGLRDGTMNWEQASAILFTGYGPGPYFVGYEMTKAIDRRYGPTRVASLLQQHPALFFRTYIELYRQDPSAVPAKFSAETERYIESIQLE
jgi:hypothetical protein